MSISTIRLIGASEEREMNRRSGVDELHIGWQKECQEQRQSAPDGRVFRAPLVTWWVGGDQGQFVPTLRFVRVPSQSRSLARLLGGSVTEEWAVDVEALKRDIEKQLCTSGVAQVPAVA
ncbi:hypothetical protein [Marinobacter sp. SS21]|uniref:hypothetical protein n=1 Tax=Marinobacter sp. SS21 TaxID=2979460 RepID=UPI00232CC1FA|nr:hypothetical protein [Marinobacter sp. SS21]MDC0664230.1 hypothetical protein [Marinobacter sp. SS21]